MTNEDDNNDDEDDEGDDEMGEEDDVLVFDDDGTKMVQGDDFSGLDNDDLSFDFKHNIDSKPNNDDLNSFLYEINDVINPSTETGGDVNVLKGPPPTTDQMAEVIANLDYSARIRPRADATPTITPSKSDLHETQASPPPLKRRKVDPRSGVLIREQAQDIQKFVAADTPTEPTHPNSYTVIDEAQHYSLNF